jgi:hypothetical protein
MQGTRGLPLGEKIQLGKFTAENNTFLSSNSAVCAPSVRGKLAGSTQFPTSA